jgi:hypothetical protein
MLILLIKEMAADIGNILPKIFRECVIKVEEILTDCYSAIMLIKMLAVIDLLIP